MNRVYVFTVMNKEGERYFDLLRSVRKWGWPLQTIFIPDDEPVDTILFSKSYNKWMKRKHLIIRDVIQKALARDFDKFLYLDGWDTIFVGPMKDLLKVDLNGVTFSVENNGAYPIWDYTEFFPPGATLNAGVIWGDCATYVQRCPEYECFDQLAWQREIIKDCCGLSLDVGRKVAVSLHGITDESTWGYKEGRVIYNPTGSTPLVLHGNGHWPFPAFAVTPPKLERSSL